MRRHTWALVIGSGVLAGLLILLASLQARWLDQVAQTVAAQKRAALHRNGTELADGISRELSRVFYWFQLEPADAEASEAAEVDAAAAGVLAQRWRSWRQAGRHVGLVAAVWLVGRDPQEPSFRLDPASGALQPAPWPRWPEVHESGRGGGRLFGIVTGGGAAGGPVLAVPAGGRGRPPGPPSATSRSVMVELDGAYLSATLLPALAEEHLHQSESDGGALLATLQDARGPLFVWPASSGGARQREHEPIRVLDVRPDLMTPVLLAGMSPPLRRMPDAGPMLLRRGSGPGLRGPPRGLRGPGPGPRGPGPPGGPGGPPPGPPGPRMPAWELSLSYQAGPVAAVVTGLRRRNMALGLSILTLLGGAIAALVVAVRRAQSLAERQRQFMASVSHELRTPLAVIASAAENLRDGTVDDGARVQEYGGMILAESKRLHAMVDDVLQLAAGGDLERNLRLEPLDVREIVAAALETFQPELKGRGGRVERSEPPQAPVVAGDRQALRHVLENVVGNALKYGGEVPAIAVRISHVAAPAGRQVQIAVEDRGMGIPADELGQVFEPFFRGREAVSKQIRGTGLGLSLVSRVMKAHGGSVSVDSAPGRGTCFTLTLPASSAGPGAGLPA